MYWVRGQVGLKFSSCSLLQLRVLALTASIQRRHLFLIPSPREGKFFFLIHPEMPYRLAGPWKLIPVAFPSLNSRTSKWRPSPLSWAGPINNSHTKAPYQSHVLWLFLPYFHVIFFIPLFRLNGLSDFTHAFTEAWIKNKLWTAAAASGDVGKGTAN